MARTSHLWAVVLAGGDGCRMTSVTRDARGGHVPKQFCHFGGDESLLGLALGRAGDLVDPGHVVVVVQEAHRNWWEPELRSVTPGNVLAQSANHGTAVALLYALTRVLECDRDPYLVILPSDHAVDDERVWQHTLQHACGVAMEWPEELVLVGVEPQDDPHFGWVLPGDRADDGTHTVLEFVEKPDHARAAELARRGGLCSTFAFASSGSALLRLLVGHATSLVWHYAEALRREALAPARRREAYAGIPPCDFSRDILERAPEEVRVFPSPPCGWTDLGTPGRLERWMARRQAAEAAAGKLEVSAIR